VSNLNVWHALYRLADYPVLAEAAGERTHATRLDGRACHHLYQQALDHIDWKAVTEREQSLMKSLGIARQANSRMAEEKRIGMTVADLIAALLELPPNLPVMLPAEGGVHPADAVYVSYVLSHKHDWSGTPVGQYLKASCAESNEDVTGEPFAAAIVDFKGAL
jgi:hypothetical protein